MAHGGTRERFDFGRSTRTQFELSEAGENNLLFDELQFQIERYQSASSNDHAKASALQALVEIFSDKVTSTLKNSTRGYIQELFKLLAKGSTTEVNTKFLIALVISICRDSDGSFDQSFNLPAELVRKILKLQLTEERCNSACLCQQVNGRKRNDAPKEVIYSLTEEGRFHRKRKFASTLPPIAETNAKQIVLPALNENWSPASPTPCSRKSATAPRLVRAYGSFRASRESLNHSSSMSVISSTTSQSSSFAGASDLKDNYWFEESCSYTEPSVSVPITASLAAPLEVAAISGGFHKKRKLANQAKRVPAEVESTSVAEAPTVGSTQLPITDSSTLYDKLSSVYDTFLCKSCFTASSSDSVNVRENELLQLVLVNCYLAAKVQSLASVKLDIFQSADHPSEPIAPGEAAATEEETELEHGGAGASMQSGSGGGGGAMGGAMGGAGADADEFQAIRSPQNPSSAAVSSSFYRRQAEALAQFQLAMCEESSESSSSYLRFVCDELLVAALRDLEVCCEWGEDEEQNSSTCCAHRVTLGKLWLVLGVMDSSCFRCPTNQRTITEMEVGDEDTAVTAPALLAQLLIRITPQLMADAEALISSELSTTAGHSSDIDVHMDGNITASGSPGLRGLHRSHSSQPCTPAGTAYKRSHSSNPATVSSSAGRCSDNFANLPAEWRQFQNLFNEVPIVRTRHIAADIASAACEGSHLSQYGSQSTQEDDDKGHSDESRQQQHNKQHEQAEMEIIRAVIGTPELCTAALKTLISISNDNPDAARVLVEESDADGLLAWAVAMLAWCTAWRSCLEDRQIFATSKTTSGGGASAYVGSSKALSPDETRLERFVLDTMLHLQSLLRNLTEYSTDAVSNVRVWDSLKAHAHILDNLPRQRIHNEQSALRVDAYFVKCCPTLHFLREPRLASKSSAMQRATLCDLLVEILLLETKEQLRDLEDTDEAINTLNNTAAAIQSASPARSLDAAGGTPGTHKSPDGGSKQPASAVKKGAVALLPIAELTISAYAALLLHALACETPAPMLSGCSDDSDVAGRDSAIKSSPEKVTRDQQAVVLCPSRPVVMTTSSTHKTSHLSEIITSRLPRQSWWLCSRVLKAFLSLQGQTGIMLLDNIAAVSRAVQWMAQQDEPPHSATPVSPSAAGTGAAGSQFDSPSDRRICTSSTTSTALVRNYPAKLPPPADLQERLIDFTAEDDFFAAETTSAAGAGKKNDKAAAAVAGKWVWDGSDYVWKAGDEPHFHSTSHLHLHSPPLPLEKPSAKKIAPVGRAHPSTARSLDGAVQLSQQPPTHSPATPVLTPAPASALVGVRAKVGDLLGRPPQPVNALVKEKKPTNSCAEPARTSDRLPAIYSWAQTLQNKPKVVVSVMATKPASSRPQVPYFPAPPRPTVPVLKKATHQPSPVKVSASVPQNPERTADPVESGGWRGKRKLSGVVVNGMKK